MRYLITSNKAEPYFTDWYDYPNLWNPDIGMIVYDLFAGEYTTDGKIWKEIICDHL